MWPGLGGVVASGKVHHTEVGCGSGLETDSLSPFPPSPSSEGAVRMGPRGLRTKQSPKEAASKVKNTVQDLAAKGEGSD